MNFISALQEFSIEMLKDYLDCPLKIVVTKQAYMRIAYFLMKQHPEYDQAGFIGSIHITTAGGRVEIVHDEKA